VEGRSRGQFQIGGGSLERQGLASISATRISGLSLTQTELHV